MIFVLCIFHVYNSIPLTADDTYWDSGLVRAYVHNSELQQRWAWAFLASNLRHLKGDERILDVGCSDGKIYPNNFKIRFLTSSLATDFETRLHCSTYSS